MCIADLQQTSEDLGVHAAVSGLTMSFQIVGLSGAAIHRSLSFEKQSRVGTKMRDNTPDENTP